MKEYFSKIDLQKSNPNASKNSFIAGYLITISNPMTVVWWLGIFGATVGSSIQNAPNTIVLFSNLTIIIGVILWFFLLSLLLHFGKRFINEKTMKYVSMISGIILTGFGLYFGYNAFISII